ncbi:hypothetical protein [Sporomusa sp. KB1]|uniref:hypothetical protein n=1 Tax=Sporomusa sp. KB1 TaxID=943346 RepID=UPI0011AA0C71|nr:hypothetical protein [Sporomusa sp. KB1]TWH49624.1 hypothetical protein Salpa_5863 [Sporomusa sp. KB1]
MELLGLTAKEMYDLSKEIWKTNEEELAKSMSKAIQEEKTPEDILRRYTNEMALKFIPIVLTRVIEANNEKITSQIQELLKK